MKIKVKFATPSIKSISLEGDDKYSILILRTKLHLMSQMGAREAFLIF